MLTLHVSYKSANILWYFYDLVESKTSKARLMLLFLVGLIKSYVFYLDCFKSLAAFIDVKTIEVANQIKEGGINVKLPILISSDAVLNWLSFRQETFFTIWHFFI